MDLKLYNAVRCSDKNLIIRELQSSNEKTLVEVTPQRGTVLHAAARFRKTEIAALILENHPSLVCQKNSKGDTPLHIAARIGNSDMVRLLVNHKVAELEQEVDEADEKLVQIVNMKGETALHDAVRGGHLEVVTLLIGKDPLLATLTTGEGESPLFLAVERMYIEVAAHILSILSDDAPSCSFQGRNNMNALHAAIIHGCNLDFIKELLRNMSPYAILEGDNSGWTALHHAASLGEESILEELLSTDKSNSIAYARDQEGMTALHVAAKEGRVDIMRKLGQRCPDIWDLVDNKGQTALHVATKIGNSKKIVEFILKEVPDDIINQQDNEGNSSLHLAASGGNLGVVELLIDDERVNETAINNQGVAVMDILLSYYSKLSSQEKVIDWVTADRLARLKSVINKRKKQGMLSVSEVEHTKKISKVAEGSGNLFKNNIPAVKDDENGKEDKVIANYNTVVATLIATVSFAAAVTVLGGYKSDGPDAGLAILGRKASFEVFVVANSVAFALSVGSLLGYFNGGPGSQGRASIDPEDVRGLMVCSVASWLIAFITGSYAVLADHRALSIAVVVLTSCVFSCTFTFYSTESPEPRESVNQVVLGNAMRIARRMASLRGRGSY